MGNIKTLDLLIIELQRETSLKAPMFYASPNPILEQTSTTMPTFL
jgi:hypothetical protein